MATRRAMLGVLVNGRLPVLQSDATRVTVFPPLKLQFDMGALAMANGSAHFAVFVASGLPIPAGAGVAVYVKLDAGPFEYCGCAFQT